MSDTRQLDWKVIDAQKRNIAGMSDEKLGREWFIVTRFPERPPIREAYISEMADEFARRGLTQPKDERR